MLVLLNPTAEKFATKKIEQLQRPISLKGKVVGLLDNSQDNFALFLNTVGDALVNELGAAKTVYLRKRSVWDKATPEMLDEMAKQCDVVITGLGH